MDHLTSLKQQYLRKIFFSNFIVILLNVGVVALCMYFKIDLLFTVIAAISSGLIFSVLFSWMVSGKLLKPIDMIQSVVSFTVNSSRGGTAPDIDKLRTGRDLVNALADQIYNLAGGSTEDQNKIKNPDGTNASQNFDIIESIAVPLVGMDKDQNVTFANSAFAKYIAKPSDQILGQPIYDSLNLSFQGGNSFDEWLNSISGTSVTSTKLWDRVRHVIDSDNSKQFDMAASFSSGSSSGTDVTIALFDKTELYGKDDNEIGFVALAVHELRTPLTIMRGYIEVFEDELGPTLSPELTQFMHKMHASAQQLAAFVGNILNVARIEENQLALKLRTEDIGSILKIAIEDLQLRAQVHGKNITLTVAENLPPVAADRISVHEVINNLVDNAIKYSGKGVEIEVKATLNTDNLIEVSVKDSGIGIPSSVMGELFQKFHRSHKSSVQVGGTGLGLYLCKALVNAHGGNIWVRSKEAEGSIFSFTLIPFDQLSAEQVEGEDGIIRGAHGWIKNHSLYRN